MIKRPYDHLVCPQCHLPLSLKDDRLACRTCASPFPIISNIPCFTTGESAWRFPLSDSSDNIIKVARTQGWQASLENADKEKVAWIRGNERFTLSLLASPKGRVLDAGCGWGGLSFWLADEFSEVWALDSRLDGLEFIHIRSGQEGIKNISPVQGDLLNLPFPDSFFDLVLLNGVLEWVGTFSKEGTAKNLQEMALCEMQRVLKPDGTLYVAIENRFGLQYFLGYREEHTALRYVSLMPRIMARAYHKYRKGKDFRALTHSRGGLMRMLEKCGLSHTIWFSVFPSYRNCRYAASLESTGAIKFLLKNVSPSESALRGLMLRLFSPAALKISALLRIMNFVSPSWVVFASRQDKPQLVLHSEDNPLAIDNSRDATPAVAINNRRANIFITDGSSGRLKGKFTIATDPGAAKKLEMSKRSVALIRKYCPSLSENLPEISIYRTRHGLCEYTKGVPGDPLNLNNSNDLTMLSDFLMALNGISLAENDVQSIPQTFDIRNHLSTLIQRHELSGEILNTCKGTQIIHGDLNRENIILSRSRPRRLLIIDFEHAKFGPAVLNWYDFLLRNLVMYGDRFPIKTEVIRKRFYRFPGNERCHPVLNSLTVMLLKTSRIPLSLHGQLTTLYLSYLCQDPVASEPEVIISLTRSMELDIQSAQ